ncbi:MAG: HAD hydrolase-like protein [Patescibacteria group bacterium]
MEEQTTLKIGIFDADGTLFDTVDSVTKVFADIIFKRYGLDEKTSERFFKETGGLALDQQFKLLLMNEAGMILENEETNEMAEELRERIKDFPTPLFAEAIETAKLLYEILGCRLFISSNARQDRLNARVVRHMHPNYFSVWLGTDREVKIKKGIGHLMYFAGNLGLTPYDFFARAFFVSDGPPDMRLALKYGILPIGIATSVSADMLREAGAQFVISSLSELPDLIKDFNTRVLAIGPRPTA